MKHARAPQAGPRRAHPGTETSSDDLASATWGLPSGSRLKRAAAEDEEAIYESIDAALRQLDELETKPLGKSARRRVPPFPGSGRMRAVPPLPSMKPARVSKPVAAKPAPIPPSAPATLPQVETAAAAATEPPTSRWLIFVAAAIGTALLAAGAWLTVKGPAALKQLAPHSAPATIKR